jgi:hypothetical protein
VINRLKISFVVVFLTALLTACDDAPPTNDIGKLELSMAGTESISDDFNSESSAWKFFDGTWGFRKSDSKDNGVLAQVDSNLGRRVFPLALWQQSQFSDVDVSVRFKPVSGEMDASGGLVFRAKDEGNYYIVRANSLEDNFRLYTFTDGNRSKIASTAVPIPALGQWHTIRVVALGSHIQVYLNDILYIDHQDTTFSQGYVGIWTKADAVTEFDDLVVRGFPVTTQ